MNKENNLLIFVKNTEIGKVKTRLAKSIGDKKALEVYYQLLIYTHNITQKLPVDKIVYYNEWIAKDDIFSGVDYYKAIQTEGDLGEKMKSAFENVFDRNATRVIIIGSDCPELTTDIISKAFEALQKYDAVIGPAVDGGYYLLGMRQFLPFLFKDKKWSTADVFPKTIADLKDNNVSYYELPQLRDIDTEEDYLLLKHNLS